MRVVTFDTLSESFVNNFNNCLKIHSRHQSHKKSTINNIDERSNERWFDGTINRIFKLLRLDELTHLTTEQIDQVKALVTEFKQIVSEHENDIGCTDIMEQTIVLDTHIPVRAKYRNIPLAHRQEAEREVKRLLDVGVIQHSES